MRVTPSQPLTSLATPFCPRLGIVDWGIGGLGFYRALKARRPDVPVLYLSDAGEIPYGRLSSPALVDRLRHVLLYLARHGADHVVVACNAASTVLPRIPGLGTESLPTVTGVIEHAIRSIRGAPGTTVGVIGGRRTIRSGVYRTGLRERGFVVRQRVAQPLSACIERGELDSQELHHHLRHILSPLQGVDLLLLACTHYAAITEAISVYLPDVPILDPVDEMLAWIEHGWDLPHVSVADLFLTTGDPETMIVSARRAFGVDMPSVVQIDRSLSSSISI